MSKVRPTPKSSTAPSGRCHGSIRCRPRSARQFGVGGPNYTSSFHVIGEIFDRVYTFGGLITAPHEGIQTVTVAPGGAVITEFKTQVPGNYTLVDHALSRLERGLAGILSVEGPPNPEIFNGKVMPGMGH